MGNLNKLATQLTSFTAIQQNTLLHTIVHTFENKNENNNIFNKILNIFGFFLHRVSISI